MLQQVIEEAYVYFTFDRESEEAKNILIETAFSKFRLTIPGYFELIPLICQYTSSNPESSDLVPLVEYCEIQVIGEAIEYVRNNPTSYNDIDILKLVFYYRTFNEIEYIYLVYFSKLGYNEKMWLAILDHKQYNYKINATILLIMYDEIKFDSLKTDVQKKIRKEEIINKLL